MKLVSLKSLAAVALLGATGALNAASQSFTGYTPSQFGYSAPEIGTSINLPLFDSNLGTLTAVDFVFTGFITGTNSLFNGNNSPTSYQLGQGSDFSFTLPSADNGSVSVQVSQNLLNVPAGDTATGNGGAFNNSPFSVLLANFGFFQNAGGGNFNVSVATLSSNFSAYLGGDEGESVTLTQIFGLRGQVDVRYTYDPIEVPEPASALALLGVTAAGLVRRKRRA
jgi:hypothetical protein